MVDSAPVPAIREAIKQNEIGNASPYGLSYARLGASGASFGIFQGDTNVNHLARATLMRALQAASAAGNAIARIMAAVSQPCQNGNPLSAADSGVADAALSSPAGVALVDAMDANLLQVVLGELDSCIASSASRGHTIEPAALLCVVLQTDLRRLWPGLRPSASAALCAIIA